MGAREIDYYNERYKGSLTDKQCEMLEQIIELDSNRAVDTSLKHIIHNMSDSDVDDFIQDMENYGYPLKDYEKPIGELRDYQTLGVAYGYYAGNFILGDSVGTGKTVETAGICNLYKTIFNQQGKDFKYLVLTEKNLSKQFRAEMVKFTGDFVERIPSGEERDIDRFINNNPYNTPLEYSVVGTHALIKAPKFLSWLEQCRTYGNGFPFYMLIVDESSVLGGKSTTQIVKSFKSISKYFKKIIFLNATPFETSLQVFYNQLNLLDSKMLPTKQNFEKEYCIMRYNGMYSVPSGKYKNQANFKKRVGYFYFARTRRDNGAVMEDCKGGVVFSPLSPIQKEWLNKTQLNRMVFDCPNYLDSSIPFCSETVPKLGSLDKLLKNECADANSILLFTYYKEAQYALSKWLRDKGYSNEVLNGATKGVDRDRIIKGFKNSEFRVLITNVQKGLNFGDCNYCIFYSFDPNPSKMVQFEGRTTRSFDIVGKNVYILCSKGLEEKQLNEIVRQRAKATTDATNTDISVVLDVLLGGAKDDDN